MNAPQANFRRWWVPFLSVLVKIAPWANTPRVLALKKRVYAWTVRLASTLTSQAFLLKVLANRAVQDDTMNCLARLLFLLARCAQPDIGLMYPTRQAPATASHV